MVRLTNIPNFSNLLGSITHQFTRMTLVADLDELHLRIRDAFVKRLYGDALAAFRSDSLRGAIVTLWTAVVFDIVAKLRELEIAGDAQAARQLQDFESARRQNDVESALRFERSVLVFARDTFELITHQEHDDLQRLQADRNRCAHPSMNSPDEAYMPSAELVRYHLHSAAQHLFVRPPVQGKAALQRLFDEVRSPFFPRDTVNAARILGGGPLGRAKPALVRNFVIASMKAVLAGAEAADAQLAGAILVSLAATRSFHAAMSRATVAEVVPRLSQQMPPEHVGRVLRLAAALPEVLDHIPDDVVGRLEVYVDAIPREELNPGLLVALRHPGFDDRARRRLRQLDWRQLTALVAQEPTRAAGYPEVVECVVEVYSRSRSWDMSNELGPRAIVPLATAISWPDVQRILRAVADNGELSHAFSTSEVLTRLRELAGENQSAFDQLGRSLRLGGRFPDLFPDSAPPPADARDELPSAAS